jgi:hypothetical protein
MATLISIKKINDLNTNFKKGDEFSEGDYYYKIQETYNFVKYYRARTNILLDKYEENFKKVNINNIIVDYGKKNSKNSKIKHSNNDETPIDPNDYFVKTYYNSIISYNDKNYLISQYIDNKSALFFFKKKMKKGAISEIGLVIPIKDNVLDLEIRKYTVPTDIAENVNISNLKLKDVIKIKGKGHIDFIKRLFCSEKK